MLAAFEHRSRSGIFSYLHMCVIQTSAWIKLMQHCSRLSRLSASRLGSSTAEWTAATVTSHIIINIIIVICSNLKAIPLQQLFHDTSKLFQSSNVITGRAIALTCYISHSAKHRKSRFRIFDPSWSQTAEPPLIKLDTVYTTFRDMSIFHFRRLGLKIPIPAHCGEFFRV